MTVVLPPGSPIGILGGGQLARMLALAGARLGLKSHIYAPEEESPAFQVAAAHTAADYLDLAALAEFAASVDAVTYEFENVPVAAVRFLEALKPVRPGSKALETAQDRLREKRLARDLGAMTADYASVNSWTNWTGASPRSAFPPCSRPTALAMTARARRSFCTRAMLKPPGPP